MIERRRTPCEGGRRREDGGAASSSRAQRQPGLPRPLSDVIGDLGEVALIQRVLVDERLGCHERILAVVVPDPERTQPPPPGTSISMGRT